jgi:intracellular multiplication protein IcmW
MPDLSHESAIEFWNGFMSGSIAHIIAFIEHTENWVNSSDPTVVESLAKLGTYLDTATEESNLSEEELVKICAALHLSQKLRIMQISDSISPGLATKMIKAAEANAADDNMSKIFLQRNLIFERMRIISRLLSPNRIQLVQKIYES